MSSTMMRRPAQEEAADPREGWLSGVAAYTHTVFDAQRFGQTRTNPGSGEPKYAVTLIFVGDKLRERAQTTIGAAIAAVIDDTYASETKLRKAVPRGLRGVTREPLLKRVADYPKMWPGCPDDEALFVRLGSVQPPLLVDADGEALTPDAARLVIRSGALVHAMFRSFHYETGGDPGISLGLSAIKYARPGYKMGTYTTMDDVQRTAPGSDPKSSDDLFADLDI